MKRPRFLFAISNARDGGAGALEDVRLRLARAMPEAELRLDQGNALAFVIGLPAARGANGLLVGTVLRADGRTIGEGELAASLGEPGRLIRDYWGGYVALLAKPDGAAPAVLRAPLGDLACLWSRLGDCWLAASDLAMLMIAGLAKPKLDAAGLSRQLLTEDLRREDTCLGGISELAGGSLLAFSSGAPRASGLWSPWTFATHRRQAMNRQEASRLLRETCLAAVAARARLCGPVLLKLSGGLDSSIVAACLNRAGHPFSALNLVTDDPAGDEREHARLVATTLSISLEEALRDPRRVDPKQSLATRLPRPTARSFAQESLRHARAVADRAAAGAIFDGGGGDNVFCSLQSVRPVADCLMTFGGLGYANETTASIAELAQASLGTIVFRGMAMCLRRSKSYRWPVDRRFLTVKAWREDQAALEHPWLKPPAGSLPGRIAHVALVAAAQSVADGMDPEDELPTISPLISQPLVEACLTIPSWCWFEDGRNRAAARRAFAGMLPEAILWRRSKGAPDCFIAEVYERNRKGLEGFLLDGVLAGLGLLDLDALETILRDVSPVRGTDFLRVMQLADTESWARSWA